MVTPSSVTERSVRGKPYRWTSPDTAGFRPSAPSIFCQSISWALAKPETNRVPIAKNDIIPTRMIISFMGSWPGCVFGPHKVAGMDRLRKAEHKTTPVRIAIAPRDDHGSQDQLPELK